MFNDGNFVSLDRFNKWAKLFLYVGSAQIITQILSLVSGVLVVRYLPVEEYAVYTLAIAAISTISALADGGIVMGVVGEGGKVRGDCRMLGSVIASGFRLRKIFSIIAFLFAAPVMIYQNTAHRIGLLNAIILTAFIALAFYSNMLMGLYSVVLNLHQKAGAFQLISIKQSLIRVVLIGVTLYIYPNISLLILITVMVQFYAAFSLRKVASENCDFSSPHDPHVTKSLLNLVKRVMPDTIFSCLSSQLTIWVASFMGNTLALAQVGALGRLSQVWILVASVNGLLVFPRFACLPADGRRLSLMYIKVILSIGLIGISLTLGLSFAPKSILWVLGPEYSSLTQAAVLAMAGGAISLLAGTACNFGSSRGIVINPWIGIPSQLLVQIIAIKLLNISSLNGLLMLNIVTQSFQFLMHFTYVINRFNGMPQCLQGDTQVA